MHIPRLVLVLVLTNLVLGTFTSAEAAGSDSAWPPASPEKLPRWRGFNLLNKFQLADNTPFDEADFRMIHEWGFNFVRIPMDYRIWIENGNWASFNPRAAFQDLDQAIAWGEKYHVHICLNFHRAPGYTVASPPEKASLWTDPEAQRVCAMEWGLFARHFKGVSSDRLSFDLFNEPADVDPQTYAKVVGIVAGAIRAWDPDRLIICDGLNYGNTPVPDLIPLHVAQAMHDYVPMQVTHYQASWVPGSDKWPVPTWPMLAAVPGTLYGPWKADLKSTLTLSGDFPPGTRLDLTVGTVSARGKLVIHSDDNVELDTTFVSGPESKQGEKVVYIKQYDSYQNVFNQTKSIWLAKPAHRITISNDDGDWLTLTALSLRLKEAGPIYDIPLSQEWGKKEPTLTFDPSRPGTPWAGGDIQDRAWLWDHQFAPWTDLAAKGAGVMVGEFGCNNKTPYDVTLRWMDDTLANCRRAGWGWALWNLKGSFGILDSDRPGAVYEDYEGHKLDRKMLELLQKY